MFLHFPFYLGSSILDKQQYTECSQCVYLNKIFGIYTLIHYGHGQIKTGIQSVTMRIPQSL